MNNMLYQIGRIVFALLLAYYGIAHLTNAAAMSAMVHASLAPVALPLVYVTGVCLIAAAISFIINKWAKWAGIFTALFLVVVVLTVHVPGLPEMTSMAMITKDLMIAAGALVLAGTSR